MAENKKSFVLYADLIKSIDHLTNEEKGILFTHLLQYVNDMNPVLTDRLLLTAWKPIELQLKRDLIKFEEVKQKRSEAGKRSAELRALKSDEQQPTNSTSVESVKQRSTNPTDNVNDNDNDNDNVNDNVINKRVNKFTAPTLLEVQTYFTENGYTNELGKKAFDYYSVANWKDSKGNQVKNWKQKMRGVWFKDENKEQQFSKNFQSPFKPIAL
jgi:hypothetical protein